jgi:hypothetical protein
VQYISHPLTIWPGKGHRRRAASLLLAAGLTAAAMTAFAVPSAGAASVCDPGADVCSVVPATAQTPLGPVTVDVSTAGVVIVQLTPTVPDTLVAGIPVPIPPGPPALPGYARNSITTACTTVNIDTFQAPGAPQGQFTLPNLAIVSIHPPSPCRVSINGTTVTFTPIHPPGPC